MKFYVFAIVLSAAVFSAFFAVTCKWLLDRGATPNSVFLLSSLFVFVCSLFICAMLACSPSDDEKLQITTKGFTGWSIGALAASAMGVTVFTYLFLTVLDMDDVSSLIPLRNVAIILLTVLGGSFCLGETITAARALALAFMLSGIGLLCFF